MILNPLIMIFSPEEKGRKPFFFRYRMLMLRKTMRLLRTVRYLRPGQLYGRLWFRLYRPSPDLSPVPCLRPLSGRWIHPARRTPSLLRPWVFRFLNVEQELAAAGDWNNSAHDRLWQYNLHYFDDLNAENALSRSEWHRELLLRWVAENSPAEGAGWEPYPTSLRIVNWIKWSLAGNTLPQECVSSLAVQTRWLTKRLEVHLLGNHLFSNAKALVFAGLFFEGEEADRWLDEGLSILAEQIPEQILPDGGQFELSPMYHALALEDMLDLCNMASAYDRVLGEDSEEVIAGWRKVVYRMRRWLVTMLHPDGEISFFNDAAMGVSPAPALIEDYAERLGISGSMVSDEIIPLDDSGYIRIERPDMIALLDVARVGPDYLPGHAHADTLSFEMSLFGQRIFVNSGTSRYGQGEGRRRERATSAHNTVEINGEDSSEVWGGFRVGRRAYPSGPEICDEGGRTMIAATHDGYRWLPGNNHHYRSWSFAPGSVLIEDCITGTFRKAVARFHLHPNVQLESLLDETRAQLLLPQGRKVMVDVEGGRLRIEDGSWHPQFGVSVPNLCLAVDFEDQQVRTTIRWSAL